MSPFAGYETLRAGLSVCSLASRPCLMASLAARRPGKPCVLTGGAHAIAERGPERMYISAGLCYPSQRRVESHIVQKTFGFQQRMESVQNLQPTISPSQLAHVVEASLAWNSQPWCDVHCHSSERREPEQLLSLGLLPRHDILGCLKRASSIL